MYNVYLVESFSYDSHISIKDLSYSVMPHFSNTNMSKSSDSVINFFTSRSDGRVSTVELYGPKGSLFNPI